MPQQPTNPPESLPICVVGAGYVGLSTGLVLAFLGHQVTFLEHDPDKLAMLQAGQLPFHEPHLLQLLHITSERVRFGQRPERVVPQSRLIFLTVGTPSLPGGQVDLSALRAAVVQAGSYLHPHQPTLIINRSTAPVGSLFQLARLLEKTAPGRPHTLIGSPEFLREGQALFDSFYPSRLLVGAFHPGDAEALLGVMRPVLEQSFEPPSFLHRPPGLKQIPFRVTDPATAELAKYASNAFLATKISFINEMAQLAEATGAQIDQVAQVMGLDPRIGPDFLQAGLGWGGSCLGKDTAALVDLAQQHHLDLPLVKAARQVNQQQPHRVIHHLENLLGPLHRRRVGLLGLAFKPHTDDLRDAPSLGLIGHLRERGALVWAHDPAVTARIEGVKQVTTELELAQHCDALVLATEWPQYLQLDWNTLARQMEQPLMVDTRNALDSSLLHQAGFVYRSIGRPGLVMP